MVWPSFNGRLLKEGQQTLDHLHEAGQLGRPPLQYPDLLLAAARLVLVRAAQLPGKLLAGTLALAVHCYLSALRKALVVVSVAVHTADRMQISPAAAHSLGDLRATRALLLQSDSTQNQFTLQFKVDWI